MKWGRLSVSGNVISLFHFSFVALMYNPKMPTNWMSFPVFHLISSLTRRIQWLFTLLSVCGLVNGAGDLLKLHQNLCHMLHVVNSRNLAFSIENVKRITNNCQTCSVIKPSSTDSNHEHSWKPHNLLKSLTKISRGHYQGNRYFITMIDEYSRFQFVFPWPHISAKWNSHIMSVLHILNFWGFSVHPLWSKNRF